MKKIFGSFVLLLTFASGAIAQTTGDGFSVGGVGNFGGTAVNPVTENGWSSLNDYRAARDCCSYTNTAIDAQLWTDAGNADANSPSQITGANCAAANYQALRTACTGPGSACQATDRDTFLPMRDFNQQNPCLSPNYGSYADYQAATARGFGLSQLDVNLIAEANTNAWDAYCPGSDCSTANRGQFLDAKAGKNLFLAALADAATTSQDGSLTWAQLTAQYGSYQVSVSDPFNSAPENDWLMLYLNESTNNNPTAMASATSPAGWKVLVDAATTNSSKIALWMIQRIQAGELATSYLTANLLGKAGLGQNYTSSDVVTQVVAAITDTSLTQASDVASAGSMQTWIDGLVTATWDASPATSIAKVTNDVSGSGAAIVTSSASLGGSGTLTYSLTGDESSSFSVSSSGVITTSAALAAGTFNFNVVASPLVGNDISKAFTVTVTDPAANIVASLTANTAVSTTDINNLVASQSTTVDSDLDLTSNAIHLSYVQACMQGKTDAAQLSACASTVDGADLNKYVVAEVLSGSQSGTVTSSVLQDAGISSAVADIAAGNTCGPNQDQSCLTAALAAGISGKSDVSQNNIETVLANYFTTAVASEPLSIPTASGATGCSGGQTVFAVPNPPTLCASFANWNCTGITDGITVVWNDSGKGNINADSTVFNGGQYQVRARLTIGSTVREKTLSGTFNLQAAVAGAANGFKTASDPGYWGNPYNPIARAKSRCEGWGGSLATHAEIRAANAAHGTIVADGTRVIFRAANGDATAYTGSGSTTKPQCSNDFYQNGNNNIKGFTYKWNNNAYCDGRARSENFTSLCKDIPSC